MEIRLATRDDVADIMEFIKKYWNKNHILATDREFFEWMYVDGDMCYFEIAKYQGDICGIYGFIPYSKDSSIDVGASIWKAVYCEEEPFVGLVLYDKLFQDVPIRHYLALGLSKKACRISQMEGNRVESMKHFYRLGRRNAYRIAKIGDDTNLPIRKAGGVFFHFTDKKMFLDKISDTWLKQFLVYKDTAYLVHRYFEHPVYDYQCYGICHGDSEILALLFCRFVEQNGGRILKLIDYIGKPEDLSWIGEPIQDMIDEEELEYVDLYSYGISEEDMSAAGFRRRTGDVNIIPNYFEPFVQDNVEINIEVPDHELYMFRGDGDMDRPNFREKERK